MNMFQDKSDDDVSYNIQILLAESRAREILLSTYGTILVSISGGSDSDIVMDLVERFKGNQDVRYIWFDTGLEYKATKQHLPYLEQRYGVTIERMKAVTPIPASCKNKGVPLLSKDVSEKIHRLQLHNFKWEDKPFEELIIEYPKCKSALRWWCNRRNKSKSTGNIKQFAYLKEFMIENPPEHTVSGFCCEGAKKRPLKKAIKNYNASLMVTGERQAEGGVRAMTIISCFTEAKDTGKGYEIARYRPIFFFSDADKREYEYLHNIVHSDCYTKYGMKRTGCAGCPFGSGFEDELKTIEVYEPKLFKAANAIFGSSYEYTRRYHEYKERRKAEEKERKAKERAAPIKGQYDFLEE